MLEHDACGKSRNHSEQHISAHFFLTRSEVKINSRFSRLIGFLKYTFTHKSLQP